MSRVLVIAEHNDTELSPASLNTVSAALKVPEAQIDIAVLAGQGNEVAARVAQISGVTRVLLIERPDNSPYLAAIWAPQIAELARKYTHVFAPATTFGKDLLPRAAALAGVGVLSDILSIDGPWRFDRPIYAGNAIVTVEADPERTVFATVRTTAFDPPPDGSRVPIEPIELSIDLPEHTRFVERRSSNQAGPDLQTAGSVVAGGRGLGGSEGAELIERLAKTLGAAVGASRAAVDAGWMANDLQVGQTGKIIAPSLYLGIGISGAIQHLTGIKDADTIVAINKDADAPICSIADIVLVADLFSAIPELIAGIEARDAS
jgi:electron transfer flavoprotein alpha subunit